MTLAWTAALDALTAAAANAGQTDRADALAVVAKLRDLGAKYDAALAAGDLAVVPGSTPAEVRASRIAEAHATAERAGRYLARVTQFAVPSGSGAALALAALAGLDRRADLNAPHVAFAFARVTRALAGVDAATTAATGAAAVERDLAAAMDDAARWTEYLG